MQVAIVGGGICGLYLAWKLAERKEKVVLFEKKSKIGKECCSGLISERILDFIPQSREVVENEIDFCILHFPKKTLKIKFSKKILVIDRVKLDNLVAKLAQKSGAKIILGKEIKKENFENLKEKFNKIVGCDGANSFVRKILSLKERQNFRLSLKMEISQKDFSNFVQTWITPQGFLWKIPRGKKIEYGIIENPKKALFLFKEFLNKNNIKLEKIKSALIYQDFFLPSNKKITLCGEAVGLTKPWSGGGVIWSLICAEIFLKNFPDFLKYKKELKKFFLFKILTSKIVTKLVYLLGTNFSFVFPKNCQIETDFLL